MCVFECMNIKCIFKISAPRSGAGQLVNVYFSFLYTNRLIFEKMTNEFEECFGEFLY